MNNEIHNAMHDKAKLVNGISPFPSNSTHSSIFYLGECLLPSDVKVFWYDTISSIDRCKCSTMFPILFSSQVHIDTPRPQNDSFCGSTLRGVILGVLFFSIRCTHEYKLGGATNHPRHR